jgi:hypothetical protein
MLSQPPICLISILTGQFHFLPDFLLLWCEWCTMHHLQNKLLEWILLTKGFPTVYYLSNSVTVWVLFHFRLHFIEEKSPQQRGDEHSREEGVISVLWGPDVSGKHKGGDGAVSGGLGACGPTPHVRFNERQTWYTKFTHLLISFKRISSAKAPFFLFGSPKFAPN